MQLEIRHLKWSPLSQNGGDAAGKPVHLTQSAEASIARCGRTVGCGRFSNAGNRQMRHGRGEGRAIARYTGALDETGACGKRDSRVPWRWRGQGSAEPFTGMLPVVSLAAATTDTFSA